MEEALRESVKITAQREMVVHDLEVKVKRTEIQVSFLEIYLLPRSIHFQLRIDKMTLRRVAGALEAAGDGAGARSGVGLAR